MMATIYSTAGGLASLHRVDMFPQTQLPDHTLATLDANGSASCCPQGLVTLKVAFFLAHGQGMRLKDPILIRVTTSKDIDLG